MSWRVNNRCRTKKKNKKEREKVNGRSERRRGNKKNAGMGRKGMTSRSVDSSSAASQLCCSIIVSAALTVNENDPDRLHAGRWSRYPRPKPTSPDNPTRPPRITPTSGRLEAGAIPDCVSFRGGRMSVHQSPGPGAGCS